MNQEKTTPQSASQRKTKVIRVVESDYQKINDTARVLAKLFCKKAKALSIQVYQRGKNRNIPGKADAVRCLMLPALESGYDGMSVENLAYWYVEDMFKKAGAV